MRQLVAVLALLLVAAPPAQAQLGGLLNRAKKAAQEAVQRETPETTSSTPTRETVTRQATEAAQTAQETASSDGVLAPTGPMPISEMDYAPAIDTRAWYHQLSAMRSIRDPDNPTIADEYYASVRILFPVSDARYQAVITTATGEVVTWRDLKLEVDPRMPVTGHLSPEAGYADFERPFEEKAGAYRIAITANGHEIGAVDFEITVEASDDPFVTSSAVSIQGPWQSLGVLSWRDAEDDETFRLEFGAWVSPDLTSADFGRFTYGLYRDGERLTDDDQLFGTTKASEPGWGRWTKPFIVNRYPLHLKDLSDGDYEIRIAEEGRAPVRTFPFRIEGGVPVAHARSPLDYTPRADFLTPRTIESINSGNVFPVNYVWLEAE